MTLALACHVPVSAPKHTRADRAATLQERIVAGLRVDSELGSLPIVVTTQAAHRNRGHVRIEVRGLAPTPGLREAAIALVIREAVQSSLRFHVVDRLHMDAPISGFAA